MLQMEEMDRRLTKVALMVGGLVVVDALLLVPLLLSALRWPRYLWPSLGGYLALTTGFLALAVYLLHRWGLLRLPGRALRALGLLLLAISALTGAYLGLAVAWPPSALPALLPYLAAVGLAVYATARWQASALGFRCNSCGAVFQAGLSTWLLTPVLGSRKLVTCRACGAQNWAEMVDLKGARLYRG